MSKPASTEEIRLTGIGVSPGIAIAPLQLTGSRFEEPETRYLGPDAPPREKTRLQEALTATREQIRTLQGEIDDSGGTDHASIFDAHLLVLDDATVIDEVLRVIEERQINADSAYYRVINRYLESLRKIADPYLRERAIDIEEPPLARQRASPGNPVHRFRRAQCHRGA